MIETGSIEVGSRAPDFRLPSSHGDVIALADYRGKANVVLFFVRAYT
jgi:peroxiredoxin